MLENEEIIIKELNSGKNVKNYEGSNPCWTNNAMICEDGGEPEPLVCWCMPKFPRSSPVGG